MPRRTTKQGLKSARRGIQARKLSMRCTIAEKSAGRDGEVWTDTTSPVTSTNAWGWIEPISSTEQNFLQSTAPQSTHRGYFRDTVTLKAGNSIVFDSIRYIVTDVVLTQDRFITAFLRV